MGVFPHFFSGSPLKIATNLVLPGLPLAVQSIKAVAPLVATGIQSLHSVGSIQTTPKAAAPQHAPVGAYQPVSPSGSYLQPQQYSPSPYAPTPYSYAPAADTFSPYGGPSWGSSIPLTPSSPTPWATYSAPVQTPSQGDRTWEDLASLAPLVTAFL